MAQGRGKNAIIVSLVGVIFLIMAVEMFYLVKQNQGLKAQIQKLSHREAESIPLGATAPPFSLSALSGKRTSLSEYQGVNLVLIFFSTECPGCLIDIPNWKRLSSLQNDGIFVLGMTESDSGAVRAFLRAYALDFDVALDPEGKVKQSYHCGSVPQKIWVNREGKVALVEAGAVSLGASGKLAQELENM